jgi:hypothetical protein
LAASFIASYRRLFRLIVEWQNVLLANPSAWFETFQRPGALLDTYGSMTLPHYVTLKLPPDGTRQYCRVIWRKENRIGVEFE